MRVILSILLPSLLAAGVFADSSIMKSDTEITWHDLRKTPRVVAYPRSPIIHTVEEVADYLKNHAQLFKLSPDLEGMIFEKSDESLLGTHYHFQQTLNGLKVAAAEIIVSVDNITGEIYNIFNNTFPVKQESIRAKSALSKDQAIDIAWNSLRVHGELIDVPGISLEYRDINGKMTLVFVTFIATQAPLGHFEHVIDAVTGEILVKRDTSISRTKRSEWPESIDAYTGPILDRKTAQKQLREKIKRLEDSAATRANGKGLVFDPDPRTTLRDITLSDDSPAERFEGAYFEEVLRDISYDGSQYSLKGPWVEIANFESPGTPPSKTTDGNWNFKRGNNAFNDVMTYYHIDKNQRYMQSLGFTGARGIQYLSIMVDSDGLGGDDNSHFIPHSNRVAFGHGCVDDNEDADVILHEYGHAIHHSINNNWNGGDTGAMGEGFGDYWAASYSLSKGGDAFYPNEVFTWDGHGQNNPCWPGRVLNAIDARYDANHRYGAHTGIAGGFQSDELWSTPLFQSLLALMDLGIPREEVDRIILESHFGLGGDITMRELANNTVRVARALYPNGPHADVFTEKFVFQNIIELPKAMLSAAAITLESAGANGFADPGETVGLYVPIRNQGTLPAQRIKAELTTSSSRVRIINGNAVYNDVEVGGEQENVTPFMIEIAPNFACGTSIDLTLKLSFEGGALKEKILNIRLPTGTPWPNPNTFSAIANATIPDNNPRGLVSKLVIANTGATIKSAGLSVDVELRHAYRGDIKLTLISPKGTRVILHNNAGGSADDIVGNYPQTFMPAEPYRKLEGEALDGEWKLEAVDNANSDEGSLTAWGIRAEFSRICG